MGNPSDPPAQFIIDKLAEAASDTRNHGYAPATGVVSLRREVASRYLRKWGVRLDPETEVLGTLGSKEGFGHLCLAMIDPGDDVIVPAPSYPAHVYAVAIASGIQLPSTQRSRINSCQRSRHAVGVRPGRRKCSLLISPITRRRQLWRKIFIKMSFQ